MIESMNSPATFFDALAADYDAMTDIGSRLVRERPFFHVLIERYDVRTAIDVGTGTGVHAILMAKLGVRVTAVDVSAEMLRIARLNASRHGVRLRTLCTDLKTLGEVVTGTFDAVVSLGNTFAHLYRTEDLVEALAGFRRIVHRQSVAVIQVLNYAKLLGKEEIILSTREREGAVFERSYRPSGDLLEFRTTVRRGPNTHTQSVLHRPWRADELVRAIERAGFASTTTFGGIDLKPFDATTSTDLFLIATTASA